MNKQPALGRFMINSQISHTERQQNTGHQISSVLSQPSTQGQSFSKNIYVTYYTKFYFYGTKIKVKIFHHWPKNYKIHLSIQPTAWEVKFKMYSLKTRNAVVTARKKLTCEAINTRYNHKQDILDKFTTTSFKSSRNIR